MSHIYHMIFQSSVAYVLNEFYLFELFFASLSHARLEQYLEGINVSCSRTQTAAVPPVRLEPVTLRSRVKHSTIKSLRSLTNFALWVKRQWGFISLYIGL